MANLWYYTKGEERMGPVSSADLKRLAAAGDLKPDDLIWKEGLEDWKPASQLGGLFGDASQPVAASVAGGPAGGHPMYWQIALIVAAVLLIASMFLPWWSFRMKGKVKDIEEKLTEEHEVEVPRRGGKEPPFKFKRRRPKPEFVNNLTSSLPWYLRNVTGASVKSNLVDFWDKSDSDTEVDVRIKIWGWHTNVGLSAGFIGFAILPLALVMLVSATARRYSFAASFLAAYAGFVLLVLSLVWYLDSPGWDLGPINQFAHFGPYLAMAGSLLVMTFGLLDGILGLKASRRPL